MEKFLLITIAVMVASTGCLKKKTVNERLLEPQEPVEPVEIVAPVTSQGTDGIDEDIVNIATLEQIEAAARAA